MSRRLLRVMPETDPVQVEIDAMVAEGARASWACQCPYSPTDLFRFCAWMAGFNDARKEGRE